LSVFKFTETPPVGIGQVFVLANKDSFIGGTVQTNSGYQRCEIVEFFVEFYFSYARMSFKAICGQKLSLCLIKPKQQKVTSVFSFKKMKKTTHSFNF
jgi:hypothetical protein